MSGLSANDVEDVSSDTLASRRLISGLKEGGADDVLTGAAKVSLSPSSFPPLSASSDETSLHTWASDGAIKPALSQTPLPAPHGISTPIGHNRLPEVRFGDFGHAPATDAVKAEPITPRPSQSSLV